MLGLTCRSIDRKTGIAGFADALISIGWLADHPEGVRIVGFEEHNGSSAKRRCQTSKRVATHKTVNAKVTHTALAKDEVGVRGALAREEKRREDTEEEANASLSTSAPPKIADCPHEAIIGLFAKHMPDLPKPRLELWRSGKNAKALAQRWRWVLTAKKGGGERYAQTTDDAMAWFDRYFEYAAESDFLMGRKTEFVCNMAWLVKAENFEKVLSGNFHKELKVAA
jgi:hypothetical protein